MSTSLFSAEQIQDLREEFVEFYINDMNTEQMADWIRTTYLAELTDAQRMKSEMRLMIMMKTCMKNLHLWY